MTNFEFVFSLLGLLLGLALANVLSGLSNALQERRKLKVGTLTPLLGLLITLDITSYWTVAWSLRGALQPQLFFSAVRPRGDWHLLFHLANGLSEKHCRVAGLRRVLLGAQTVAVGLRDLL